MLKTASLITILACSLSACGAVPPPTVDPQEIAYTAQAVLPTPTAQPPTETPALPSTATPEVLSDCFISFNFAAWQDRDGNGQWEASEPPLAGVKFSPPDGFAQIWGYPYLSKVDGRVTITAWSPGACPARDLTVMAVAPASYEPTTPVSISFSLTPADSSYEAQFGFQAVTK